MMLWWSEISVDHQSLDAGPWFSPGTSISFTNKIDHHDIAVILLKVALKPVESGVKTINNNPNPPLCQY